jgi:hypothetical protein
VQILLTTLVVNRRLISTKTEHTSINFTFNNNEENILAKALPDLSEAARPCPCSSLEENSNRVSASREGGLE